MKNELIYTSVAEALCDFNFSPLLHKAVKGFLPANPNKLQIHEIINEWIPDLLAKTEPMKAALIAHGEHEKAKTIEQVVNTYLFDGYRQYFENLIPQVDEERFPLTFCHNDCLGGNFLMNRSDNRQMILIDYEYGGWNPMAMDIANFLNETMSDG